MANATKKKPVSELSELEALQKITMYAAASDKKLGTIKSIMVFVLVVNIIAATVAMFSMM